MRPAVANGRSRRVLRRRRTDVSHARSGSGRHGVIVGLLDNSEQPNSNTLFGSAASVPYSELCLCNPKCNKSPSAPIMADTNSRSLSRPIFNKPASP